jgi:hypothetical protein
VAGHCLARPPAARVKKIAIEAVFSPEKLTRLTGEPAQLTNVSLF